jgi:hypothetical protein
MRGNLSGRVRLTSPIPWTESPRASFFQTRAKANSMTNSAIGPILEEIGQLIADVLHGENPNGAFMYAEAGDRWQEISIFKDLGNHLTFRFGSAELGNAVQRLWEVEAPDKKWATLCYTISEGKFDADFTFPEDLDPEETSLDRRARARIIRFGDKPVDYSVPE